MGYEIFDPPVTMKMFKALKAEVSCLGKDLQDLSEKLKRLETSELRSSTQRKVGQPEGWIQFPHTNMSIHTCRSILQSIMAQGK